MYEGIPASLQKLATTTDGNHSVSSSTSSIISSAILFFHSRCLSQTSICIIDLFIACVQATFLLFFRSSSRILQNT